MADTAEETLRKWEQFEQRSPDAASRYLLARPELAATIAAARAEIAQRRSRQSVGNAGGSALDEYQRRAGAERAASDERVADDLAWRAKAKEQHPFLGRVASAMTPTEEARPESQSTAAWKKGSEGEESVASILQGCDRVFALHDRKVPGSRANIDHIAVAPTAVFVIDAKKYSGEAEKRNVGGYFRSDERLYVKGRDRTELVDAMNRQVEVVRDAAGVEIRAAGLEIRPVLCFIDTDFGWMSMLRQKPLVIRGVTVTWPRALLNLVGAEGTPPWATLDQLAATIAERLPGKS